MPEYARRHRSPRRPCPREPGKPLLRGAAPQMLHALRRLGERKIADRPDIRASQRHQEVDVRGPGTDPRYLEQPRARLIVAKSREAFELQLAVDDAHGEGATIRRLLPRQTGPAEAGLAHPCDVARRHPAGRSLQPRVRGGAGRERDLLLQDDPEKCRKTRASRPQGRRPETLDDVREMAVAVAERPDALKQRVRGQWR